MTKEQTLLQETVKLQNKAESLARQFHDDIFNCEKTEEVLKFLLMSYGREFEKIAIESLELFKQKRK